MRSVPEWAASEIRPRLWVARPVPSLSAMSASAANTDQSAVFRWPSTPESVRSGLDADRLGRPDERVLPEREVAAPRLAPGERHDRSQLDLGIGRTEQPAVVVHLGARVGGEDAVALGQERLERAGCRVEGLVRRPEAGGEHAAGLPDSDALGLLPPVDGLEGHPREKRRDTVDPPDTQRGEAARGVDAEEPDARQAVGAA